jgi:hypothetical protein
LQTASGTLMPRSLRSWRAEACQRLSGRIEQRTQEGRNIMIEGYIKRLDKYILNRRFENIPRAQLRQDWLRAFAAVATDPSDSAARTELNDLTSEFHFRGRIPPYYQLKIQAHECIRAVDSAL